MIRVLRLGAFFCSLTKMPWRAAVGESRLAGCVGEAVSDFRLGGIVADWYAKRASTRDAKAGFHPLHRIWQHDRDCVAGFDAIVREMTCYFGRTVQQFA